MENQIGLNRELRGLKQDKQATELELKRTVNRMAFLLKGEMGKDIKNVINGKTKVKFTKKEKIKNFFNNIFTKF